MKIKHISLWALTTLLTICSQTNLSAQSNTKQTKEIEAKISIADVKGEDEPSNAISIVDLQPVEEDAKDKVLMMVEEMPQYPGGDQAMMQFIASNLVYPKQAVDENIQGRVIIRFVVDKDGSVKNAEVMRSPDQRLAKEALRVINKMPTWKPGMQKGEPVAVYYTIPIVFKLPPQDTPTSKKEEADHMNSLMAGMLVVLDGEFIDAGKIMNINPDDIDSVEVIEDKEKMKELYGDKAKGKDKLVIMKSKSPK